MSISRKPPMSDVRPGGTAAAGANQAAGLGGNSSVTARPEDIGPAGAPRAMPFTAADAHALKTAPLTATSTGTVAATTDAATIKRDARDDFRGDEGLLFDPRGNPLHIVNSDGELDFGVTRAEGVPSAIRTNLEHLGTMMLDKVDCANAMAQAKRVAQAANARLADAESAARHAEAGRISDSVPPGAARSQANVAAAAAKLADEAVKDAERKLAEVTEVVVRWNGEIKKMLQDPRAQTLSHPHTKVVEKRDRVADDRAAAEDLALEIAVASHEAGGEDEGRLLGRRELYGFAVGFAIGIPLWTLVDATDRDPAAPILLMAASHAILAIGGAIFGHLTRDII